MPDHVGYAAQVHIDDLGKLAVALFPQWAERIHDAGVVDQDVGQGIVFEHLGRPECDLRVEGHIAHHEIVRSSVIHPQVKNFRSAATAADDGMTQAHEFFRQR